MLQHTSQKVIEFTFYCLFFFTPLILWPQTSEVFEFNKMLFVYALTAVIFTAWLTKSFAQGTFSLRRTPLDLPILLFLISQTLSTIFSIDTHTSVWGYYSRFHGGLASTISYLVLFYALVTHFDDKAPRLNYLLYSLIGSSSLVAIYGILERLGIDKHLWVQDVQSRVFSTLGQPNWLSAYFAALLPLTLHFSLNHSLKKYRFSFLILSLIIFISAIFTRSRSGVGATLLGIILILSYNFYKSKSLKFITVPALAVVLSVILFGTPWTPAPNEIRNSITRGGPVWPQFETKLNMLGLTSVLKPVDTNTLSETEKREESMRAQGLRVGGSDSFEIRRHVWEGAVKLGLQNPLFGTGLETFGYTYFAVKPIAHNLTSEWDFLYNKAHNEYLNTLANAGFVGLGTYLFLIFCIIKLFIKTSDQKTHHMKAGLAFGFTTILITNYFGFSVVNVALFFFLFPALLIISSLNSSKYWTINLPKNNFIYLTLIWLLGLYTVSIPYQQFKADLAYNRGRFLSGTSALKTAIDSLQTAISLSPSEPLFVAQLAETQSLAAVNIATQLKELDPSASNSATLIKQGENLLNEFVSGALTNSAKAISMNPHQTNFYKTQGKVGIYLSTIDGRYTQLAIESLEKLLQLAPTDAKTAYNIGLMYENQKSYSDAKKYYELAVSLKSDYQDPVARLEVIKSMNQ